MHLSRRELLGTAPAILSGAARRPNVVMFMTDDHGAWANGIYGCAEMHTPIVDRLAREGVRFDRAYAATPVCSPSRMTWMTGLMPSAHGVQDWLLPRDSYGAHSRRWLEGKTTWSEILAQNGYTLGMCGKWHMGMDDSAQAGFSYWASVPGGSGPYRDAEFVVNGEKRKTTGFKEDAIGDFALDFLDRSKGKSFGLLMPFYAPHTPYDFQPEEDRAWYAQAKFSCFPESGVHPNQNKGLRQHHGNKASMLAYSALISAMDRNVGRVLKRLDEMGARQNTVVIFTADQGWNAGHHGVWGKGNGTVPYNMYEESIRVPLIWNQPGRIRGGRTTDALISSYDFFPTLLQYLGLSAPPDERRQGASYVEILAGKAPRWRDRLFFEYSYVRAVRTRNLKYIERTKEWKSEFYDLEADPGEKRNAIDDPAQAKQIEALRGQMGEFFRRAGAPPLEQWRSTTAQELPADK